MQRTDNRLTNVYILISNNVSVPKVKPHCCRLLAVVHAIHGTNISDADVYAMVHTGKTRTNVVCSDKVNYLFSIAATLKSLCKSVSDYIQYLFTPSLITEIVLVAARGENGRESCEISSLVEHTGLSLCPWLFIMAFLVTPAVLNLSNWKFSVVLLIHRKYSLQFNETEPKP